MSKSMRSIREILSRLPINGDVRHKLRNFNMMPRVSSEAASVKLLAESFGIDVRMVALKKGMAGRLVQDPFSDSGYCIEVNQYHDVRSRRFTVLHELGHYFLHAQKNDPFAMPMHLSRREDEFYFDQKSETEANDFADVLLFGDGALEAAWTLYQGKLDHIAHYFGVSENMIKIALKKFAVK